MTTQLRSRRALLLSDASTRSAFGLVHGPSGGDKAAGEQSLLGQDMDSMPHVFTRERIWILDRNFRGADRPPHRAPAC